MTLLDDERKAEAVLSHLLSLCILVSPVPLLPH